MINGLIEGSTGNTRQANVARVTKLPATSLYIAARPSAWAIVRQRTEKVSRLVNRTYVYHDLEFRPSSLTTFVGHRTHIGSFYGSGASAPAAFEGVGQPLLAKDLVAHSPAVAGVQPKVLVGES